MHHIIVLLYVISGSANVLLIKWSNMQKFECSDGKLRDFYHPVLLTFCASFGELLCFAIYKIAYHILRYRGDGSENTNLITAGARTFNIRELIDSSTCHVIGTLMLFIGLYLNYASSFQMIRIFTLIFVGIFSTMYLNTTLTLRHWIAMITICIGIIDVIVYDLVRRKFDTISLPYANFNAFLTGNLLIACACILEAANITHTEKFLKATNTPVMQIVGWHGIIGCLFTLLCAIALNFVPMQISPFDNSSRHVFDDLMDFLSQLNSNPVLVFGLLIFFCTVAIHSYTGAFIVQFSSGSNLLMADQLRVVIIWCVAFLFDWEQLYLVTIIAFVIIQIGVINYRKATLIQWIHSVILRVTRQNYSNMSNEPQMPANADVVTSNHPADVI